MRNNNKKTKTKKQQKQQRKTTANSNPPLEEFCLQHSPLRLFFTRMNFNHNVKKKNIRQDFTNFRFNNFNLTQTTYMCKVI